MRVHLPLTLIVSLILLSLTGPGGQAEAEVRLPQMGEPADQALSPRDEARIGRHLMIHARRTLDIDRDPQIAAYINDVGQRLAANANGQPIDGYTFFVIHQNEINALAAPGGYVGMFTGLIAEAETEGQLAGVLAHEIAHVSQRHIARRIAEQQQAMPVTLAQIIAGILIGTVNPQAGQAAIMGGMGRAAQQQLDYTRSIEAEADRVGIRILAATGYDPEGMAEFFEILMRQELGAVDSVPEYLRTHPLSSSRVAEARGRARDLATPDMRRDTSEFQLMRARLRALQTTNPAALAERWSDQGEHSRADVELGRQYGLALLDLRRDRPGPAADRIARLREGDRDNLHLLLAAAEAARAMGNAEQADGYFRQARDLHPTSWPAVLEHAEMLRQQGDADGAAGILTRFLREHDNVPASMWRAQGRALEEAGRSIASREALAEWYTRSHRYDEAVRQLEIGLDEVETGSNAEHRLRARLDDVRSKQRGRLARDPLTEGLRGSQFDHSPRRVLPDLDAPSPIPVQSSPSTTTQSGETKP